jgi:hypothetical protein
MTMAGRPGRSGGWNKLSPEEHRVRGTKPRLRARPPTITATPVPRAEPIPERVTAGLQAPGRAFAEGAWRDYCGWSGVDLTLLRQAARVLDDAEAATNPRLRQSSIRLFAVLVSQLRLEPMPEPAPANPLDKYIKPSRWAGLVKERRGIF